MICHPDIPSINSQWFPTSISIFMICVRGILNDRLTKKLPLLQSIMLFVHIAGFVAAIATLWATSPRESVQDTLFNSTNGGGWSSAGTATLIGVLTPWSSVVGNDSGMHMSESVVLSTSCRRPNADRTLLHIAENVQDASRVIPLALMASFTLNSVLALVAGVTLAFCIGDVAEVLSNPNQAPFITVYIKSTGSKAAAVVLTLPILLCFMSALVSQIATASRQMWSFSRDGG